MSDHQTRSKAPKTKSTGTTIAMTITGFIVGACTKTIFAPLERTKILLQTHMSHPDVYHGRVAPYSGFVGCIREVRKNHSTAGLWRGNLANCLSGVPRGFSTLLLNDTINNAFPKVDAKTQFWQSVGVKLLAGGLASGVYEAAAYPLTYCHTRMAAEVAPKKHQFNGIYHCLTSSVATQGISSLYTGLSISVASMFVYRGTQLGLFAQVQDMNPYRRDQGVLGAASSFAAVSCARTIALLLTYPFDTVRRRLMLEAEKPKPERIYSGGIPHCVKDIMRREGVRGFYRGGVVELCNGLTASLIIIGYDRWKVIKQQL